MPYPDQNVQDDPITKECIKNDEETEPEEYFHKLSWQGEAKVIAILLIGEMPGDCFQKDRNEVIFFVFNVLKQVSRNNSQHEIAAENEELTCWAVFTDK